jgi:hypothetical protein
MICECACALAYNSRDIMIMKCPRCSTGDVWGRMSWYGWEDAYLGHLEETGQVSNPDPTMYCPPRSVRMATVDLSVGAVNVR